MGSWRKFANFDMWDPKRMSTIEEGRGEWIQLSSLEIYSCTICSAALSPVPRFDQVCVHLQCVGDHKLQAFYTLYVKRFKNLHTTLTWKPMRGGDLKQITSCGKFSFQVTFKMKRSCMAFYERPPESTHRVAMATFWSTFHHDDKICPTWWGWRVYVLPLSLYLQSRAKLWCTLQLRGQIHFPYFSSTPIRTLWCPPSTGGRTKSKDQSAEIPPKYQYLQRVYKVLGFLSSRPNWAPPPPRLEVNVAPPPFGSKGVTQTRLRGKGSGDPITPKGQTFWYSVYGWVYTLATSDSSHKVSIMTTCPVRLCDDLQSVKTF